MMKFELLRGSLAIVSGFLLNVGTVSAADAPPRCSGKEALAKLVDGNKKYASHEQTAEVRKALTSSQTPFAVIVGCADSRVSPEIIFDQGLGDLFVVRSAGNVVNGPLLGSIEYAVEHLGARAVLVVGHDDCGAVKAALEAPSFTPNVETIINKIKASLPKGEKDLEAAVEANARGVAQRIRDSKPELKSLAKGDEVLVKAAIYDLDTGKVKILED